jgi:hypothetical protein
VAFEPSHGLGDILEARIEPTNVAALVVHADAVRHRPRDAGWRDVVDPMG